MGQRAERITVYTAITGKRDLPRNDITCFGEYDWFKRPVLSAKIYKILPHKFLDTDISIWLDGNIYLLIPPEQLVKEFLGDNEMAVWKHFDRNCIYKEAVAAKGLYPEDKEYQVMIDGQIEHYKKIGFPENVGLAECNVIIRKHNKKTERFNEAWWAEICRWGWRDQLSFPVVLSRFKDSRVNFVEGNPRNHEYFKYNPH
jgi:hypothetical protein